MFYLVTTIIQNNSPPHHSLFLHLIQSSNRQCLSRQREYKMAAINAKQSRDIDRAKQLYLTAKVTQPMSVLSL